MSGNFVISLDFELMWGVRDKKNIAQYGKNIIRVHEVIPKLISLFSQYHINATFSTVGFLFFRNQQDWKDNFPKKLPQYNDNNLSPYHTLIDDTTEIPYYFAPEIINLLKHHPNHEIGTHTFSHYYCLEPGQTLETFEADLQSACKIARKYGIDTTSIVFPRNQMRKDYLSICKKNGIISFRGNEKTFFYAAKNADKENALRRIFRLLDTYINISGHHCFSPEITDEKMVNIPSSRFLRPYSPKLSFLEHLRLKRILKSMTFAAKNKLTYHLWWHPHNFGNYTEENFIFLDKILQHYKKLEKQYHYKSKTMSVLAQETLTSVNV